MTCDMLVMLFFLLGRYVNRCMSYILLMRRCLNLEVKVFSVDESFRASGTLLQVLTQEYSNEFLSFSFEGKGRMK